MGEGGQKRKTGGGRGVNRIRQGGEWTRRSEAARGYELQKQRDAPGGTEWEWKRRASVFITAAAVWGASARPSARTVIPRRRRAGRTEGGDCVTGLGNEPGELPVGGDDGWISHQGAPPRRAQGGERGASKDPLAVGIRSCQRRVSLPIIDQKKTTCKLFWWLSNRFRGFFSSQNLKKKKHLLAPAS